MSRPATISLIGAQHPTIVPSFGVREDLCIAWGTHGAEQNLRGMRVYAAAVGACSTLGARAGASWQRAGWDVLAYGDTVYSWLREQGASAQDIVEAAVPVLQWLAADLFPREEEVKDAAGFSPGDAAPPTAPPSS